MLGTLTSAGLARRPSPPIHELPPLVVRPLRDNNEGITPLHPFAAVPSGPPLTRRRRQLGA
eukprot:2381233-Alexandrium_andersonii.AAC.1